MATGSHTEGDDTSTDYDDYDEEDSAIQSSYALKDFVGSNLFGEARLMKKCFMPEDVALLTARKQFEVKDFLVIFIPL